MGRRASDNPKYGNKTWTWTAKRVQAAQLVAEDDMKHARIAEEVGVSGATLANWKATPEFRERVVEYEAELEAEMLRLPIARKRKRVAGYDDLKRRLLMVIEDREEVYVQDAEVVAGRTGLIVKQTKSVGYGKNSQIVTENAFDAALIRELRAVDEQAAKELGQWVDKGELTGANGGPLVITDILVDRSAAPEGTVDDDDDEPDDD